MTTTTLSRLPIDVMAGIDRVYVIAVDTAERLIMLRRRPPGAQHCHWEFPSARPHHPRIPPHVTATRVLHDLGYQPHALHLIQVLPAARDRRRAAIYAATVTAIGHPNAEPLTITAAIIRALDLRPRELATLVADAGPTPTAAVTHLVAAAMARTPAAPDRNRLACQPEGGRA